MKQLYVVTHPEAVHHIEGRVGGWYDSALTELGLQQADRIGRRLRQLIPQEARAELYASDLQRTMQTAEVIARALSIPVQGTASLREISYGEAEGRPQAWLDARFVFPPRIGNRMDHQYGLAGAESRRDVAERVYQAMEQIVASPCAHQIIVTHGFALTFVVAAWIKMPREAADYFAVQATSGGITLLVEDDVFSNRSIVHLNDTAHLE